SWGENVAAGYPSVDAVMAGWLGSDGHCANLMNPGFTEFGAGESGRYWTQGFARPR
ncbi:MAG: CAP domain-containing protein, partial [Trueperaceae bacterium]